MPYLIYLFHVLVALVEGVVLPLGALIVVGIVILELPQWWARAGERQQRIEIARAEVHVRHLEGQLHRARTHLAALKSAQL
jgi:hypothetical protein